MLAVLLHSSLETRFRDLPCFFDAQISGPAIIHITHEPDGFWASIIAFVGDYFSIPALRLDG
jgi:hypothetical protein